MGWKLFWSLAIYAFFTGGVVAQINLGDILNLGDLLDQYRDDDSVDDAITTAPGGGGGDDVPDVSLTCYDCKVSDSANKESCTAPTRETHNGTLCDPAPPGSVTHCGWMEATVSTPDPLNPGMNRELYTMFRGCIQIPTNLKLTDKCFNDAELVDTMKTLDMALTDIVGGDETSTIKGQGCFCTKEYCNGASIVRPSTIGLLVAVMAAVYAAVS